MESLVQHIFDLTDRLQILPTPSGLYGDFCSGRLLAALPENDGTRQSQELLVTGFNVTTFDEDEAGEPYVVDYKGDQSALYEIVSGTVAPWPRATPASRPTP